MHWTGDWPRLLAAGAWLAGCVAPATTPPERTRPPIAVGSPAPAAAPVLALPDAELLDARVLPDGTPAAAATTHEELALVRLGLSDEGLVPAREHDGLAPAIEAAYAELEARHGALASVFLESVTTTPSAAHFSALVSEPRDAPSLGVVFLHGYGGNFTWPCALVAEVVREVGGATVCPSVGRDGAWWTGEGPAIARASIAALRAQGADAIVLAGLSNGSIGAARLAESVGPLAGLVLISGAPRGAHTDLPALVVHGTDDTMTPTAAARAFVRRSPHAELELAPGGHFVLAHERDAIRARLGAWLRALVSRLRPE